MITITIETDNAAFDFPNFGDEASRILQELAFQISDRSHAPSKSALGPQDELYYLVRDHNGNRVGKMIVS
jgi:hypothetical protein